MSSTNHNTKKKTDIYVTEFTEAALTSFRKEVQEVVEGGVGFIKIVINSYGGSVYNCITMMNILETLEIPIITVCEGYAMSAGAALLTCGDKGFRFAHPDATIMIHQMSTFLMGGMSEIENDIEHSKILQDRLLNKMAKNIGKKPGYFQGVFKKANFQDIFMTAEEACSMGIVNELKLPNIQVVTEQHVELS